jgi:hypothetical protein
VGGLDEVKIASDGLLTARVGLYHFELEHMEAGGTAQELLKNGLEALGQEGLDTLSEALPPIQIPVRLEQSVRIGAIEEGPIRVEGGQLPLKMALRRVIPLSGRLWVVLDIDAEEWQSLPEASREPAAIPPGGKTP